MIDSCGTVHYVRLGLTSLSKKEIDKKARRFRVLPEYNAP